MCFFILPFRLQDHCLSLPEATRGLGRLGFVTEEIQRESPQKIKKEKGIKECVIKKGFLGLKGELAVSSHNNKSK